MADWERKHSKFYLEEIWDRLCPDRENHSVFDGLTIEEKFVIYCVGHEYLQGLKTPLNKRLVKIALTLNQEEQEQKKRQEFFEKQLKTEIDKYLFVDANKKNLPNTVLKAMRSLSREIFISTGKTEEDYLMYLEYLNNLE